MAIRLLPYRQYDEQDVVNLFSFGGTINAKPSETNADSGMLVKVSSSDLSAPPVEYLSSHSLLGKTDYPHVARNGYPQVPLKVVAAGDGDAAILGITLNQTLTHDENDENLLRYPQKKAELFAVTSGEAVPIATKGIFTFDGSAVSHVKGSDVDQNGVEVDGNEGDAAWKCDGTENLVAVASATAGKIHLKRKAHANETYVGKVLGTGKRTAQTEDDQFAKSGSSHYVVVKLDL
jgi:hypothetical protein